MRILIFVLFAAPLFASAQQKAEGEICWFSPKKGEHQAVITKGCTTKMCTHIVACGKTKKTGTFARQVFIKPNANGTCDGYDAEEALVRADKDGLVAEAEVQRFPHNGTPECVKCMKECPHNSREMRECDTGCPKVCTPQPPAAKK